MFHRLSGNRNLCGSGGDPQSKDPNFPPQSLGTGGFIDPKTGAPRYIPLEINRRKLRFTVERWRVIIFLIHQCCSIRGGDGATQQPDLASQFYIALADLSWMATMPSLGL